jgi:UDP-N-acetyl-D-mannosaminuronic acid dehydrogenase
VIETDAPTAEIAKLAENTYRDVNIAFANQLALICEQHGVDATEVIKLANTHPKVNIHTPGPGVGGPCLPKDPYLLTHMTTPRTLDMIRTARRINDQMPKHIIRQTIRALQRTGKNPENSRVAILGTAYKADMGDSRGSSSKPIIRGLMELGAKVKVYDPHCKEAFGAQKAQSLEDAVRDADCIIVVTDHTRFKYLNLRRIKTLMGTNPTIIDGRRIVNPREAESVGFSYYGVGYSKAE